MKRLTVVLILVSFLLACSVYIAVGMTVSMNDDWQMLILMKNESIIRCTYDCHGILVEGHYNTANPGKVKEDTFVDAISYHGGLTSSLPELDPMRIDGIYWAYFTGWYLDRECTTAYDPSTPLTSYVTVYAGWRIYTVIPYDKK